MFFVDNFTFLLFKYTIFFVDNFKFLLLKYNIFLWTILHFCCLSTIFCRHETKLYMKKTETGQKRSEYTLDPIQKVCFWTFWMKSSTFLNYRTLTFWHRQASWCRTAILVTEFSISTSQPYSYIQSAPFGCITLWLSTLFKFFDNYSKFSNVHIV